MRVCFCASNVTLNFLSLQISLFFFPNQTIPDFIDNFNLIELIFVRLIIIKTSFSGCRQFKLFLLLSLQSTTFKNLSNLFFFYSFNYKLFIPSINNELKQNKRLWMWLKFIFVNCKRYSLKGWHIGITRIQILSSSSDFSVHLPLAVLPAIRLI